MTECLHAIQPEEQFLSCSAHACMLLLELPSVGCAPCLEGT